MLSNLKYFVYFSFLSLVITAVTGNEGTRTCFLYYISILQPSLSKHLQVFYFIPSEGACGHINTDTDIVASVSRAFFDSYPSVLRAPYSIFSLTLI